jgi:hypothetical protein
VILEQCQESFYFANMRVTFQFSYKALGALFLALLSLFSIGANSASAVGTLSSFNFYKVGFPIDSISGSQDGRYVLAAGGAGYVRVSNNFGAAWSLPSVVSSQSNYYFTTAGTSNDGRVMVLGGYRSTDSTGAVFVSIDYGSTWNPVVGNYNYGVNPSQTVTVSGDGLTIYTADRNYDRQMFKSTFTSGAWSNWSKLANSPTTRYSKVSTNFNGQVIIATTSLVGVSYSRDYGATWALSNSLDSMFQWLDPNANTTTGLGLAIDTTQGQLWRTANSGSTWSRVTSVPNVVGEKFWGVTSSNDGKRIYLSGARNLYRSIDSGATWTTVDVGGESANNSNGPIFSAGTIVGNIVLYTEARADLELATATFTVSLATQVQSLTGTAGNNQVTLTWSAPASNGDAPGITDYIVKYKASGDSAWTTFADGVKFTTGAVVTGLVNGTSYTFTVSPVTTYGEGAQNTSSSYMPATAPGAPTSLSALGGDGKVSLSWTAPASNGGSAITDYTVQYQLSSGGAFTSFAHTASPATAIEVTGLTNGTAYKFKVAAVNGIGSTFSGLTAAVTPKAVPTFTWADFSKSYGDAGFTIPAPTVSSSIAGTFTYISGTTATATISSSGAIAVIAPGSTIITATFTPTNTALYQSGGTATILLTVTKKAPVFSSFADIGKTYGDSTFSSAATISNSIPGTFSYSSSNTAVATIASDGVVTIVKAGTTVIQATFTPTDSTINAVGTASRTLTVGKKAQGAAAADYFGQAIDYGSTFTFSGNNTARISSGYSTGLTPVYTIVSGNCAISGDKMTATSIGSCVVKGTIPGGDNYLDSSVNGTIAVLKVYLDFTPVSSQFTYGQNIDPTYGITGLKGTDSVLSVVKTYTGTNSTTYGPSTTTPAEVGTYRVDFSNLILANSKNSNYTIRYSSSVAALTITKGAQSTLAVNQASATVLSPLTLTTSGGSSSGSVTYIFVSGPCDLSSNTLTPYESGTCIVKAKKAGDDSYVEVVSSASSISVTRIAQAPIILNIPADSPQYGDVFTLSSSGGSGKGAITYQVLSGPCSVSGAKVSSSGVGDCLITATKAADIVYLAATSAQKTISITKRSLTIEFIDSVMFEYGETPYDLAFKLSTLANSDDLSITSISYTNRSSLETSSTFPSVIGEYDVVATAVSFTTGTAANYQISFIATERGVRITKAFPEDPLILNLDSVIFGNTLTLSARGGKGTGEYHFEIGSGNCSITGNILSSTSAGTCIVEVWKSGDSNYYDSLLWRNSVTVTKATQAPLTIASTTLSFKSLMTLSVTGGSIDSAITFAVLGRCSIFSGGLVYTESMESCEIRATRDGNANYLPVTSASVIFAVNKASQTINLYTISQVKTQRTFSPTIEVSSGLGPTITTADSAICTASLSSITTVGEGLCTFTITQAGNTNYLAAEPVTSSFTVNGKADPEIGSFSDLNLTMGNSAALVPNALYNSSSVAGTWIFTSTDLSVLSISGSSASAIKGGLAFLTATFTPDSPNSFNTATKTIQITVAKTSQNALSITSNSVEFGKKLTLITSGGSTSRVISYVVDSGNCSIDAGVLSSTSGGNCYVTATRAGDESFESVSSSSTLITVTKIAQVPLAITSVNMGYGTPLSLVAIGGSGSGSLSYVVHSGHCTISGTSLTATDIDTPSDSANDCYVRATRAADSSYNEVSSNPTRIKISLGDQSALTITSTSATFRATYSLTTSGGSSGGSVSFVVASGNCSISGSTLSNTTAGSCSVIATMAASARYLEVSSAATVINVAKASQSSISITNSTTSATYGDSIELTSSGGSSGGSITYAVHSGHPCTISGAFLIPTSAGDCAVSATRAGGANYQNVSSSEVTFSFTKKAATIRSLTLNKNIGSNIQSVTYQVLGFVNGDSVASLTTNYLGDDVSYPLSTTVPDSSGHYIMKPSAAILSSGANASSNYEITYIDGSLTVYIGIQTPLIITSTSIDVLHILDLTTSGGSGTGAVSYIVNAGSCYIGGSQLVPTSGYNCTITATKAADSEYGFIDSEPTLITVIKQSQTLTFDPIADLPLDYVHAYANASSNRGYIVEYSSLTPAVCTASSYLVDLVSVGTCTLAANQSGDEFVGAAAQVTRSFQVNAPYVAPKSPQAPLYIYIPNSAGVVGDSVLVMPYGGTAGTPNVLTIAAPNSNSCTLEAITDTQNYWLYAESAGTCRIVFNKMGDYLFDSATAVTADVVFTAPDFSAFSVAIEIDTSVTPPSISADISTQTIDQYGTIATVTFTNSGGAVDSYNYLTVPPGLTFDPITGKLSGKMTNTSFAFAFGITATNAGGSSMASTVIAFTPISQIITFNQPFDMNLGDADQTLTATSSSSATVNRFGSSTNAICTVFKGSVQAVGEGTCTLTADLPGDLNYADAQQVSVSFTIYPVGGPPAVAPIVTRTVTYALGGGTGTLPTRPPVAEGIGFTVASGVGISRSGFTFKKWNDGTSDYSAGDIYTISTSDVVLTATWTANAPAPTPAPAPSSPVPSNPIATPAATVSTLVAPINPVVNSLVFTENTTKDGGVLSWSGTNIQSWRFIGDEKIYPAPYVYGGYTASWPGTLVNMVRGVNYTLSLEVLSTTGTGSTKTITYLLEGKTETEIAAEVAQKLAQETSVAEAKAIAEQKIAEEAALKAAEEKTAAAKTVEDARIAAEAKAAEEVRIAAEAKAAEEVRIAAEAKAAEEAALRISKEKFEAEAQAVKDAATAALAAKRLVLKFSVNMPVVKTYLNAETKALIKDYALRLLANSNVTCIGYTYSSKPTKTELTRAKNEALAACKYVVTIKKGTNYYIDVKSWLAIKPKPKAMDTKKLHRLDISSSVPLTIEEIIEMSNLVALVRKDNEWVM